MTALETLIFPSSTEQSSLSHLLTDLKRANLSIHNRLRSILQDAEFVREVAASFGDSSKRRKRWRPLVANERCGSWYVRPADKTASAYFKSTDGHTGAWKFSTRRLNLNLLGLVGECDGCIIVDSTRRGKRMPDALSKTIPIWCAVLNRALFPDHPNPTEAHALFTPPQAVSPTEHAQIEALLPSFLASLRALDLDLPALRSRIAKPLRPLWVTPDSNLTHLSELHDDDDDDDDDADADENGYKDGRPVVVFEDFHPVICCTASRRVSGGELTTIDGGGGGGGGGEGSARGDSFVYVQGAGDDTENWAHGLTAELFWTHKDLLLSTPESELPALVAQLVESTNGDNCRIVLTPAVTGRETWVKSPHEMQVGLGRHKVASRNLRTALPDICSFVTRYLQDHASDNHNHERGPEAGSRVLIACETSKDLSVATALAVSMWCFNSEGTAPRDAGKQTIFTKDLVKVRLGRIMTAYPEANPGRASLQSVNSFLMDYR
ncbi:initiator tRNA phosphoribosyl transferase [Sodiomyces alkalinus F11]|uniref:Initiator tRNA phosphoribosyl transferase n=1 Tax=Sodiomyces alkalinus (strain CBS 110278 / VKM F-3762 / F11) TaxID=1314773 RepID=A0A3N2PXG3_SODAK|nr:initiator tRNA phosphoribosyl transferase [Sodiomyces alkalinus F11]ROT39220.1 initiator tRNA phosphoribosyl transferase [Sodiomyces alkalinus F11]